MLSPLWAMFESFWTAAVIIGNFGRCLVFFLSAGHSGYFSSQNHLSLLKMTGNGQKVVKTGLKWPQK